MATRKNKSNKFRKTRSKRQRGGTTNNEELLMASINGDTGKVMTLLENEVNVDVNAKNNNNITALSYASFKGHTDIVLVLLVMGADVNIKKRSDGDTALIRASRNGHKDIVIMLLDSGANINEENKNGETALMRTTDPEVINILKTYNIEKILPNLKERQKARTKLIWALREKNVGNRGVGTMPSELLYKIGQYLGGKRKTKKATKKSKRKTRKTRKIRKTRKNKRK